MDNFMNLGNQLPDLDSISHSRIRMVDGLFKRGIISIRPVSEDVDNDDGDSISRAM